MKSEIETRSNPLKWLMPALLLLVACLTLTGCQTTSAASSSVIEDVATDTEEAICADLKPAAVTSEQFNDAPQWVRDYIVTSATVWSARCG
jgi:uncharacterized lipoprotein YajG